MRLRRIPPGRYLRGSPQSEEGRFDNEGPQHSVTISRGFWLGEVPVTQALWEAVMGENPSHFEGPSRPVERVSWKDAQAFCARLGERVAGLLPRLPTEADWEYACRAGTTGARWSEDLDAIAWHVG
ncbi:MAG: formylglycine-generating enzyme family protein, partial [Myxococcales bacterium]|nr:formylglycine-generating enzyme family protein [Myxococcales bacterium]